MADSKDFTIKAEVRTDRGKNDARRLRVAGKVPLTIYGGGEEAVSVVAQLSEVAAILRSSTGAATIFKVDVAGAGVTQVMFQDRQIHPLKGRLMHADLKRIVRGQAINMSVPLHLTGEATGVLDEGGVLDQVLTQIEVRCQADNVPEDVKVDVSALHAKQVLHVSDIPAIPNVEFVTAPDSVVATIKFAVEEQASGSLATGVEATAPADDPGVVQGGGTHEPVGSSSDAESQ